MNCLYNEIEPFAARWLANLMSVGQITPGKLDTRDIRELRAADVDGKVRAHFFAGIGVWDYALRCAGWPEDLQIWTGSCPCQPFSTAGQRKGKADERHLWPVWFDLIRQCRPSIVVGEQVASPDGLAWFDDVQTDLEGAGYAIAPFDLCAAGVGAPHIRQRIYFVAYAQEQRCIARGIVQAKRSATIEFDRRGEISNAHEIPRGDQIGIPLGNTGSEGSWGNARTVPGTQKESNSEGGEAWFVADQLIPTGSTRGFWDRADWVWCRDGKYRPVEPGLEPLVNRNSGRVGRCRAYGNAIVAPLATIFLESILDVLEVK